MMVGNRAALRYAKAIIGMAKDKNVLKEVNGDMIFMATTIAASKDLEDALKSPVVKNSAKRNILEEVFKDINGVTKGTFDVLLENNRIQLLGSVATKYQRLYDEMNNVQLAKVTTAVPLTPALEDKVQAKVKELTGHEAKIVNVVDESIIGGFILRVGDLQYNASVAAQLSSLKREFTNETYISKL